MTLSQCTHSHTHTHRGRQLLSPVHPSHMSTHSCARRGLFIPDGARRKPMCFHFLQRHKSPLPTRAHTPPVHTLALSLCHPLTPPCLLQSLLPPSFSGSLCESDTHSPHTHTCAHIGTHAHAHTPPWHFYGDRGCACEPSRPPETLQNTYNETPN